jgi:hypothetical protein
MASYDVYIVLAFRQTEQDHKNLQSQKYLFEDLGFTKVPSLYEAQCYQERHSRKVPVDTSWLAIEETIAFFLHHSAVENYDSERYKMAFRLPTGTNLSLLISMLHIPLCYL